MLQCLCSWVETDEDMRERALMGARNALRKHSEQVGQFKIAGGQAQAHCMFYFPCINSTLSFLTSSRRPVQLGKPIDGDGAGDHPASHVCGLPQAIPVARHQLARQSLPAGTLSLPYVFPLQFLWQV
jgi:hypothetical protein